LEGSAFVGDVYGDDERMLSAVFHYFKMVVGGELDEKVVDVSEDEELPLVLFEDGIGDITAEGPSLLELCEAEPQGLCGEVDEAFEVAPADAGELRLRGVRLRHTFRDIKYCNINIILTTLARRYINQLVIAEKTVANSRFHMGFINNVKNIM
jgi:hypothetical protein